MLKGNQEVHGRIVVVIGGVIPARAQTCFRKYDFEDASLKTQVRRLKGGGDVRDRQSTATAVAWMSPPPSESFAGGA